MKFSDIQIDERFRFFGLVYTKKGTRLAEDEKRSGHVFLDQAEVEPEATSDRTNPGLCNEP